MLYFQSICKPSSILYVGGPYEAHPWILLDEVNMAPASVLECLSQLLESEGSITHYEAGDYKSIPNHKDFRLFACMNPATDTGKAGLAPGLRNRYTELYCDKMADQAEITMLVTDWGTSMCRLNIFPALLLFTHR